MCGARPQISLWRDKLPGGAGVERKNLRLNDYDYRQVGMYFVTVCTRDRVHLFWDTHPVGATCGRPTLSALGKIVDGEIQHMSTVYPNVRVEKYAVMPNHIHLLICISDGNGDGRPQVAPTLSRIVQQFKGVTTKRCGRPLWQKSFYDHIIRDEYDFTTRWNYIDTNPARWREDEYFGG